MHDPPPFIFDQALSILNADAPRLNERLSPEKLRSARPKKGNRDARANGAGAEAESDLEAQWWAPLPRERLLAEVLARRMTRVFVTTDGGMGKSSLLERLQVEVHAAAPDWLVLRIDLARLWSQLAVQPLWQDRLPVAPHAARQPISLLAHLLGELPALANKTDEELERLIRRALAGKRLVLAIDALDQAPYSRDEEKKLRLDGLARFMPKDNFRQITA